MFDSGSMDKACAVGLDTSNCPDPITGHIPACPDNRYQYCPAYTYADNTPWGDGTHTILEPYFKIAEKYGFANRMFQTNQGPSLPAHLFLFSGTSAPVNKPVAKYTYFAAENAGRLNGLDNSVTGCVAPGDEFVKLIDDSHPPTEPACTSYPYSDSRCYYPCYDHPTLVDLLKSNSISWKYYARTENDLWTAPTMIKNICQPSSVPGAGCTGPDWVANVASVLPTNNDSSPILTALGANPDVTVNCTELPAVSWVIPDGHWSDHAGKEGHDGGPSFVAAIVNALGGYYNDRTPLPSSSLNCHYWDNTVVLITWDDWGGYYDHVLPFNNGAGYLNGNGSGFQYVYGFRVPLLVVSKYATQGYISNTPHDFGSILKFVEQTFGITTEINAGVYDYADHFYLETPNAPLADFFGSARTFTFITGAKYPTNCFIHPGGTGCFPGWSAADPDDDLTEGDD